ncbi:MAG: hypothetical protein ACKOA1_10680, partial [Bacteroidota bacterium]
MSSQEWRELSKHFVKSDSINHLKLFNYLFELKSDDKLSTYDPKIAFSKVFSKPDFDGQRTRLLESGFL